MNEKDLTIAPSLSDYGSLQSLRTLNEQILQEIRIWSTIHNLSKLS